MFKTKESTAPQTPTRNLPIAGTDWDALNDGIKAQDSNGKYSWNGVDGLEFNRDMHQWCETVYEALEAFYAKLLQREEGQQGGRYGEDMTFLISIYLCLVTSSVCCETGFSRWLSSPLTLCMLVEYR